MSLWPSRCVQNLCRILASQFGLFRAYRGYTLVNHHFGLSSLHQSFQICLFRHPVILAFWLNVSYLSFPQKQFTPVNLPLPGLYHYL